MARKINQVESEKKVKEQKKNVQKLLQKAAKKTVDTSHARDTKKKANKNKKKD